MQSSVIIICPQNSLLARQTRLQILYEDNHLLCVCKPPMMPVQADASGDWDLLSACKQYIKEKYQKPGAAYLGLVHRLDRPVGGVIVFARTSKAAARLSASMVAGKWEKRYLAIVEGGESTLKETGELCDYLLKDEKSRTSRVVANDCPGAKRAALRYQRLTQPRDIPSGENSEKAQQLSLISVELLTGRHHQIRVQLSGQNAYIWGDARYNPHSKPGQAIALFAHSLLFPHPVTKENIRLQSLPPQSYPWSLFEEMQAL